MLGKIIKHEFKATYGTYLLLFLSLFAVTIVEKTSQYVEMDLEIWDIFKTLLMIVFVLFVIFVSFASQIIAVVRFYKTMTKDQGYLTHTIPVKEGTIIWGKAITAFIWILVSIVAAAIASVIFLFDTEMVHDLSKLFAQAGEAIQKEPIIILWIVLTVIIAIVSIFAGIFQFYASIGLGQMFAAHKVAGAVLFYFIIYYSYNFVSMAFMVLIPENNVFGLKLSENDLVTIVLAGCIVVEAIYAAVCYWITNYRFSKRLDIQ